MSIPDDILYGTNGLAGSEDPVGHRIVNFGATGEGAAQIGEGVHRLQLGAIDVDARCVVGGVGRRLVHDYRYLAMMVSQKLSQAEAKTSILLLHIPFCLCFESANVGKKKFMDGSCGYRRLDVHPPTIDTILLAAPPASITLTTTDTTSSTAITFNHSLPATYTTTTPSIIHRISTPTCCHCNRTFSSCISLVGHLRTARIETGEPVPAASNCTRLNCLQCPRILSYRMGLQEHMRFYETLGQFTTCFTPIKTPLLTSIYTIHVHAQHLTKRVSNQHLANTGEICFSASFPCGFSVACVLRAWGYHVALGAVA
ncbi:unnamed protein product [Schistocephalus solidus]|uniref:C2H2-type domain-containing protein n=1 Tax=Schistocephalus solidus TaxID=70667 RepID=A0A183SX97_SCHSO|nr:unnamed protein product [Schistocephalus solidus]